MGKCMLALRRQASRRKLQDTAGARPSAEQHSSETCLTWCLAQLHASRAAEKR